MENFFTDSDSREMDLFIFQSPKSMMSKITELSKADTFVFDYKLEKAREAWIISLFCIGYEKLLDTKCEIMMSKDEPADAKIKINNEMIDYQIVESLTPGRKRNDEYKNWLQRGKPIEPVPYRPLDSDESTVIIRRSILDKVNKKYSINQKINLLVYVDFDRNNLYLDKLYARCRNINIKPFDEIWLFSSAFENGKSGYAIAKLLPNPVGFYLFH